MSTYAKNSKVLKSLARVGAVLFAVLATLPMAAQAQMASIQDALAEMSMGSPDAPVTLHEFSSLTCPHCATFHTEALPLIKKNYVDTGKVRIVFHDFPLDGLAEAATALARCAGPGRSVDFFDMLFQTQSNWSRSNNPLGSLTAIARFYGLSADDVATCIGSDELLTAIRDNRERSAATFGIQSTPSFLLEGQKIVGALGYDDFKDLLDKALAAKGAN